MALDSSEQPGPPITKFESMLKTDDVYFFDAEDFEEIIHHYLNHGKVSLAKKAIKMGLQQHPNSLDIRLLDVEVMVFENEFEDAERVLDELQLLAPNNEEIFVQRANIQSKQDNHLGAITLLHKALELTDEVTDLYSLLGMEYLFIDDYTMARKCFIQCLEADPEDYASLYNTIYCYEFLDEHEGAIRYLNTYLDTNPYCQIAWHQLGKQYYAVKMYPEALAAFDFAIISDDSFLGAYFEKGRVLEKLGRYEEAIENYNTTTELEDPTSHAYLRIGKCYERLNRPEKARYYFYLTVHDDPLLDKGWLAITDHYLKKKDYQKAQEYIDKALNIDGENAIYWKRSGIIHKALKQVHEADFAFKQATELGNYEEDTWLLWAEILCDSNEFETAAVVLQQGCEFHPESAQMHYQLAGVYLCLQALEKGKSTLKKALKEDPEKYSYFENRFPEISGSVWVQRLIRESRKASK
ncbi:tetratricopeptide repeat protein [Robiginitalea sp.]|uniref:tetratricopeptide repeat protein n=1 Tax=Robiginitalea sp. TaxID=1902411 RepID=UPI003C5E8CF7